MNNEFFDDCCKDVIDYELLVVGYFLFDIG